jgi:hypothetical protein
MRLEKRGVARDMSRPTPRFSSRIVTSPASDHLSMNRRAARAALPP